MMTSDASYVCYFLSNETHQRTYVGISNNVPRRLRQHNGEIKGGARATRAYGPWHIEVIVTGFVNKSQCLSFEWFMHHLRPRGRYIGNITKRLKCAMAILEIYPKRFGHLQIDVQ